MVRKKDAILKEAALNNEAKIRVIIDIPELDDKTKIDAIRLLLDGQPEEKWLAFLEAAAPKSVMTYEQMISETLHRR